MKTIFYALPFILTIGTSLSLLAKEPLSTDCKTLIVSISPKKFTSSDTFNEAIHLLQSPNIETISETNTTRLIKFISPKNEAAFISIEAARNIKGVLIECEIQHNTDPRMTGTNSHSAF